MEKKLKVKKINEQQASDSFESTSTYFKISLI